MWQDEDIPLDFGPNKFGGEEKKKEKREKRERGERSSNFSLRSTEIGWSVFVGPRTKDHLLDKGYVWVLKHEISSRIQVKSSGNQGFRV